MMIVLRQCKWNHSRGLSKLLNIKSNQQYSSKVIRRNFNLILERISSKKDTKFFFHRLGQYISAGHLYRSITMEKINS